MRLKSFEAIAAALDANEVRYLVAGGLAVNAHGYLRFTKDVDLVIGLESTNIERGINALTSIGYKPALPVKAIEFADHRTRERWIKDKGMTVFQMWSDDHRETPIDIFVTEPFPFDSEYEHALIKPLHERIEVRFVSIGTLIRMKEVSDRPQDRIDIEHLRMQEADDGSE